MGKAEQILVTTVNEFMEWASQFNQGGYLFRGVINKDYQISSSAYRRLMNTQNGDEGRSVIFEKFIQINRSLINDVRLRYLDRKDGRKLTDLEILAELQHFRAATCLIDFTYNALIALWFACDQDPNDATKCGRVVAVPTDEGYEFREVTLELLGKDIDYFFLGNDGGMQEQLYKWRPPHQNNRIIAQQSIFLFGAIGINPSQECIIHGRKKKEIRASLEQVHGIDEAMLFPDFEGFARQHNQDTPYTSLAASQYRIQGIQKINERKYGEAIAAFTEAINVNPSQSTDYQYRGAARAMFLSQSGASGNQYAGVFADYTEAISLDPNAPISYYHRGILSDRIGKTYEALQDLEKALQIAQAIGDENLIARVERIINRIQSRNDEDSEDDRFYSGDSLEVLLN